MAEQLGLLPDGGGSIPTSPLQLKFAPIRSENMNAIVVERHYSHRAVPSSWSWGAYFLGELYGVISFGKPANMQLCRGVCGPSKADRVYELNRLWMDDRAIKNSESRFIGWSLREMGRMRPQPILVSYADTAAGHSGLVYASTNWLYTGLTLERVVMSFGGKHPRHSELDPRASVTQRSKKHRFVYVFNKEDRAQLRYEVKKWKGDMK